MNSNQKDSILQRYRTQILHHHPALPAIESFVENINDQCMEFTKIWRNLKHDKLLLHANYYTTTVDGIKITTDCIKSISLILINSFDDEEVEIATISFTINNDCCSIKMNHPDQWGDYKTFDNLYQESDIYKALFDVLKYYKVTNKHNIK